MYAERVELYKKIEDFTDSRVLCYITGDRQNMAVQIANDVLEHFTEHLDKIGNSNSISLILHSRGGNTLAGWSLVNLIRQFCEKFQVIIPSRAHSTGTLIALGADSILMTKQATLGPIDPSVNGPLNPQMPGPNPLNRIPISVESINGYIEFAKSQGAQSEEEISKIILDLSSKIHPVVLGNVYRSRSQIRMLGNRLLSKHIDDSSKIGKILDFLCSESGSHDYTIYRNEAKDELGLKIIKPNAEEYSTIKALHDNYTEELKLLTPFDPNVELGKENSVNYSLMRGLIESVEGKSTKFVSEGILSKTQVPTQIPNVTQDGVKDLRLFEGWKND